MNQTDQNIDQKEEGTFLSEDEATLADIPAEHLPPPRKRIDTRKRRSSRKRTHAASSGRKKARKRSKEAMLHLVLIGAIALMFLYAIIRLILWNIGEDSGYDPNADSTEYETEALDYIQPLDRKHLEGREDDGITTILCLGNDPFTDERGPDGLAEMIADRCGATVYNCAFPGSCISMKYQQYTDAYPLDALSLYLVTASLCGGDHTLMEHAVNMLTEGRDTAMTALETLKSVDLSKVDMIVMMYDLNDYRDGRSLVDPNNDINLLTWAGALNASIQQFKQTYPYIRIVLLTPAYGSYVNEDGETVDGDTTDLGNGVLPDYVQYEVDTAMANGVSVLDNYYGTITESAAAECLTDGYRLNRTGRERIAARFAKAIFGIDVE